MVIQKTANVEPVTPVQHLLFAFVNIGNGKCSAYSFQWDDLKIIIFIIIKSTALIIKEIEFFKILVQFKVIFLIAAFLF